MNSTSVGAAPAPQISVIIPVRNGEADLTAQLEALSEQDFDGSWEVIVADNGSTDRTVEVAKEFEQRLPKLRILDASNMPGQAHALNVGAAAAQGRSLLLLDADDVVERGYLEAMARALDRYVFVAARLDNDSLNEEWLRSSRPASQADGIGAPFGHLPSAAGCSLGIHREVYLMVGGFSEEILLGTDVDFCWRVQLSGFDLHFVPDAVVRYRYRDSLKGIFTQARTYGTAGPALFKKYGYRGMSRRSLRTAARFHAAAIWRLVKVRSKADLGSVVFLIGFRVGIIEGCLRNRVWYP